jgi:Spy/CpxP family protein refolding chaperone
MWGTLKPLLVLLSVSVNGAFVAAWLSHTVPPAETNPPVAEDNGCCLRRELGATDEQWRVLEPRLAEFRQSCQAQCRTINRLRRELIDLLAAAQPDRAAIVAKQREIVDGQRKMQDLVVDQLLAAKTVLTTQQQEVLFRLIRVQCGCTEQEGPMGCCDPVIGLGACSSDGPGDGSPKVQAPRRAS